MDVFKENTQGYSSLIWLAAVAAILLVLQQILGTTRDPREPPYIQPKIPVIGHFIGILTNGAKYFNQLDEEHQQGLYSLQIPRGRIYIVGSADWSIAVQKHDSTVDLYTLTTSAMEKLFKMSKQSMEIVMKNLFDENRHSSNNVIHAMNDFMFKSLAPGKDLDELNQNILKALEPRLNGLVEDGKTRKMLLWDWIRHQFTEASMLAIYGPDNPFAKDHSLVDDFWLFDSSFASLMSLPYPAIFARKANFARRNVLNGWTDYAKMGGYRSASALIQGRAKECLAHGLEPDQYGLEESRFLPGLLTNTTPASFWLISWIFQNRQLLAAIRAEVDQCIVSGEGGKRIISISKIKSQCPLFVSAFMETLRIVSPLNNYRYVREDTMVTNNATGQTYLLKKGSMVQLATTVLHGRSDIFGEDVDSFNPSRFIPTIERTTSNTGTKSKIVDPAATFRDARGKLYGGSYRPFGGGVHMCPGRHFAQTAIIALALLFVAGFEMETEPGTGRFVPPQFKGGRGYMFLSIIQPQKDVEITLKRREGFENAEWKLEL